MGKDSRSASGLADCMHLMEASGLPKRLARMEARRILVRRLAVGASTASKRVGLALSGGGIRSATFNLGLLQALAGRGKNVSGMTPLERIDYLSTVSGGGYIGSFLGKLYCATAKECASLRGGHPSPTESRPARPNTVAARVVERLLDNNAGSVDFLRENGRYLSPNGSGDLWVAAATQLRNWISLHLLLGAFYAIPFLAWILLRIGLLRSWEASRENWVYGIYFSSSIFAPLGVLLVWMIPCGIAYWLVPGSDERKDRWWRWIAVAAIVLLQLGLAAPYFLGLFPKDTVRLGKICGWAGAGTAILTLMAIGLRLISAWVARRQQSSLRSEPCTSSSAASKDDASDDGVSRGLGRPSGLAASRRLLSEWLSSGLVWCCALLAFALTDALGQSVYALVSFTGISAIFGLLATAVLLPAVASGQKLMALLPRGTKPSRLQLPLAVISSTVALLLALAWLTTLCALCYAVAWKGEPMCTAGAQALVAGPLTLLTTCTNTADWQCVGAALALCAALSAILGHFLTFVNQSSFASLYSARLTRAYLGASNPRRLFGDRAALTQVIPGDDLRISEYAPHRVGGPLHFINVTLNETMDGRSQIEQRDRKGMPMALGPCGISVGVRHHARWSLARESSEMTLIALAPLTRSGGDGDAKSGFVVFQPGPGETRISPESLNLGRWVGISGAAVSTGLGARTSLGFSFLCGFFNLRLGHWWRSGTDPQNRTLTRRRFDLRRLFSRWFPVHVHLLHELLARFPGTQSRHWYLTDGGHFENTGAYELIRRRAPIIIVSDAGADECCEFSDLGGLVRKARNDFLADITFLTRDELERVLSPNARRYIGTLEELRGVTTDTGRRTVGKYAALALVRYEERAPASLLLYVKPGMLNDGDEPMDVAQYAATHVGFPHESTGDQFFDEAQWESYRCLGEHIGKSLFYDEPDTPAVGTGWSPARIWNEAADPVDELCAKLQVAEAAVAGTEQDGALSIGDRSQPSASRD